MFHEQIGIVKWFNFVKGYGFITSEEGKDIFVHKSDVEYVHFGEHLAEGMEVRYEIEETPRGKKATRVRTVD